MDYCSFANLVYLTKSDILKKYSERPYTYKDSYLYDVSSEPIFISSALSAECIFVHYRNSILISFRGTESTRDCLSDINITRVKMDLPITKNRPLVHWGFLRQFRSVETQLSINIWNYIRYNNKDITITVVGHSLGGGLASLAALYFTECYYNIPIKCVTFGSPRVGNRRFVKLFNKKVDSYRYVNHTDPIPSFPLAVRYSHVDGLLYINKHGKISTSHTDNRVLNFISGLFLMLYGYKCPLSDHSCDNYYSSFS